MSRLSLVCFILTACASTPQHNAKPVMVAQNQTTEPVVADRFKQRYGKLMVDSKDAPEWMRRGAGCSLGQMTAMQAGQATIVPAHLCVGIHSRAQATNATCEAAEQKAWSSLAKLFGVSDQVSYSGNSMRFAGKSIAIQGARLDASWRGAFNGSPVCALQIAWPVAEYDSLQASWGERGDEAQRLYRRAVADGADAKQRCEDLKRSGELIASIPGNRKLAGQVQNSNLLEDLITQARGTHCVAEKTAIVGVSCRMNDASTACPSRLRSSVVSAMSKSGWKVVGSALKGEELDRIVDGGQTALRQETARQSARYMGVAQVTVEKIGQRGRIQFCRANLDFRLLDGHSGSAGTTFAYSAKKGGLNPKQCFKNTAVYLAKKATKGLLEALKK